MLPILLIGGLAYGIAYWISSTGLAYWRAILGFTVAFVAAWLGGSIIGALLTSQLAPAQTFLNLLGKGFWWASIGAGFGVYRARFKLMTGVPAPAFKFPSWVVAVVGGITVIGIVAAVVLPAYQDRAKGQVTSSRPESISQISQPEPSQIDEFLKDAPTDPNPFDKFDPSTAKPVSNADWDSATITPPTQEGSPANDAYRENDMPVSDVAPTQTAETKQHYRQIYAAHPDADEIVESSAFKAWVGKYPTYQRFLTKGSAQEIVGMFTAYKNQH